VAAPSSVLQWFPLCPIESNGNENFKVIQNPGFPPDHPQNWITGSLCHSRHILKISERSTHNFLSYLADTQTNRQTKSGKNITSLAEVNKTVGDIFAQIMSDFKNYFTGRLKNLQIFILVNHRLWTLKKSQLTYLHYLCLKTGNKIMGGWIKSNVMIRKICKKMVITVPTTSNRRTKDIYEGMAWLSYN